jgi:tetratricopeptide (TPR) repeat protein
MAAKLPIEIKGTMREMVFYYYQDKRDYKKALDYAEKWLKLVPDDGEIILFQARCYRNFRDTPSLLRAERILGDLETNARTAYFRSRIYRDMARVQEALGNRQRAKELFNDGIRASTHYTENYVGLATLLLNEASELDTYDKKREAIVRRALTFLEEARKKPNPSFETLHLGLYIEALIEAGEEEKAFPLLKNALRADPDNVRLNYRMAEVLRKQGDFEEAAEYSEKSKKLGHPKIAFTLANIAYGQAQRMDRVGDREAASELLNNALQTLGTYIPDNEADHEVSDTIAAKIYRTMGNYAEAASLLSRYVDTTNPYTIYEASRIELLLARGQQSSEGSGSAFDMAKERVRSRIQGYGKAHRLPSALLSLLTSLDFEVGEESEW